MITSIIISGIFSGRLLMYTRANAQGAARDSGISYIIQLRASIK